MPYNEYLPKNVVVLKNCSTKQNSKIDFKSSLRGYLENEICLIHAVVSPHRHKNCDNFKVFYFDFYRGKIKFALLAKCQ